MYFSNGQAAAELPARSDRQQHKELLLEDLGYAASETSSITSRHFAHNCVANRWHAFRKSLKARARTRTSENVIACKAFNNVVTEQKISGGGSNSPADWQTS